MDMAPLTEQPQGDWKLFQEKLADFPHSFQMRDQELLTNNTYNSLKNHLEAALRHGYNTSLETAQSTNLLAYALFCLDMSGKALDLLDSVLQLEGQHHNLVTLANKAAILWHMTDRRPAAEEQLQFLQELRKDPENFHYLQVKARAELASSYLRFGYHFNHYAVNILEEVIPEGREPEVWNWKFALAVAHRHTLDLRHVPEDGGNDGTHFKVLAMLQEIVEKSGCDSLCANAKAEVALLIRSTWNPDTAQNLCRAAKTGVMKSSKEALNLGPDEPSVLWNVGKMFRYHRDVMNSRKHLEKAVLLQPSSAAYHHLGLTLKAFATEAKYGKPRARRGKRSDGRRRKKKDRQRDDHDEISEVAPQRAGHRERGGRRGGLPRDLDRGDGSKKETGELRTKPGRGRGRGCGRERGRDKEQSGTEHEQAEGPDTSGRHVEHSGDDLTPRHAEGWREADCGAKFSASCHAGACKPTAQLLAEVSMQEEGVSIADSGIGSLENPEREMESVRSDHQTDAPTHEDDVDEEKSHNEAMDFSTLTLGSDDEVEASGNVSATPAPNVRMMRAVKSAPTGTTRFARTDEYVADAMKYLQLAVEFSCGENTRAIYDLALMHKALGEFKEALNLLADIRGKRLLRSPLDEICALEQEGIILKEMAEREEDEAKRGQLEGEAKSMFDAALTAASEQYSNNPDTRAFIGYIWQSFSVLRELSQNSDQSNEKKMEEKARLNHLVKRHNQLIVLKQELEKLAEEENSKVMLQNHISTLVHQEHYAQALKSAQLLQCKAEGNPKDNMSIDEQYVQMLRLSVCRQALLQQSALPTSTLSTHYFHEAFVEALVSPKDPTSASQATFDTDSGKDDMVFDVMLLYEDEAQGEAAVLRDVLREACGLDVKWMEDAPPNKPELGGVLDIMYRCRLVVVVLVKGRGLSRALGLYLNHAAGKCTTVTLLLKDNCHLPKLLKTHRSRSCPAELLQPNVGRRGQYDVSTRYAIWELFCFLIGCEPDFRLPEIN